MEKIEIVCTNNKVRAEELTKMGYEPIECAFGSESVVGSLIMDHHGKYANLEGVAIRAYRDCFGARRDDPRFVVTGAADADATFAIASLAGVLPHPSRVVEFEQAPPHIRATCTRDLGTLAEMINKVDVAPIGVRLEESEEGLMILLWNRLSSSYRDELSFYAGVERWRTISEGGGAYKALVETIKVEEVNRVIEARKAKVIKVSDMVAVVDSPVWGFDVWYSEVAPVIVAYLASNQSVGVGCPNVEVAEKFFGPGGLKNVFPKLEPQGWGGRETIGGSPRGLKLGLEQVVEAAKAIDGLVLH